MSTEQKAPVYDVEAHYQQLEQKIAASGMNMDLARVRKAFDVADLAHAGQKRKDGTPYVSHCISAAIIAAEMGLDEDSIVASLLHDTVEDTSMVHEDIARAFGDTVADLVEGVTKLTRVTFMSVEEQQMENLRKMLLAMTNDIRVILIKMADRLHNMRTMDYQTEEKQRIKSLETMEVYAPIAHRLGMQRIKWELEDLSLRYLDPEGYQAITDYLDARMETLESFMQEIRTKLQTKLEAEGIPCSISSRIKHIYSIYRKMYAQKIDINGIFDLCAFRVITDDSTECYAALGVIHSMFKPVPGRFKDYISTPKPNNYQSLHTTVIGEQGIPFEVQLRTQEMHLSAEYGVAAHWKYKSGEGGVKPGDEEKFAWVRRLLETQQESEAQDFFHNLKIDMFSDEVFVFSPKGDVFTLPAGATPIDFAYSVHSGVGNSMVGAKVNGRIVNFDHVLQNGDIVEIRTSKNAPGPNRDWLQLAKSGGARTKIKQWLKKERREENEAHGKEMLERELRQAGIAPADIYSDEVLPLILKRLAFPHIEDLYAAIGYGGVTATRTVNRIRDELQRSAATAEQKTALDKINEQVERRNKRERRAVHGILVEGLDNCLIKFSRCCTPVPGDDIIGFITRGAGVSIHRKDCENYRASPKENAGRWIQVSWAEHTTDMYSTTLLVLSVQRSGLVMDIATALNSLNAKVRTLTARDVDNNLSTVNITVEVHSLSELRLMINRLTGIHGIIRVARAGSAEAKKEK